MPSNHVIHCHPLLLLPSIFPSMSIFSNKSALHIRWPKYWSYSISPSTAFSGLISFRIDWFDLLAVQGTLKSLLQHHGLKASILWCSAFFFFFNWHGSAIDLHVFPSVWSSSQSIHTTGKTIALSKWTFVSKVVFLLSNTLSRFVIAFLSKEKASFNSVVAVTIPSDFGAQENKICHCFWFFRIYLLWSDRTKYHDLSFLNVEF